MSHLELRGKTWWLVWRDESGRRCRESSGTSLKSEAKHLLSEKESQARRRKLGLEEAPLARMTFGELIDKFLKDVSSALESGADDVSRAKHLEPLRPKPLGDVVPADIRGITTQLQRDGRSPATREHVRSLARRIFNYGIKELKCFRGDNPATAKGLRVKVPKRKARYVPFKLVPIIIQAVPDEYRGIFATDAMTGLRKGEICGLQSDDVDLDGRQIHVRRTYDKDWPKDREERILPIPEALVPYLQVELGRCRSKWLFPDDQGRMRTKDWKAARAMRVALKNAGIVEGYDHKCRRKGCGYVERRADDAAARCPACNFKLWVSPVPAKYTFKDLRSTFLTQVLAATGNITFAQRLAGHSTSQLTEKHYIGHDAEAMRQAVNSLPYETSGHKRATVDPKEPPFSDQSTPTSSENSGVLKDAPGGTRTHDPRLRSPVIPVSPESGARSAKGSLGKTRAGSDSYREPLESGNRGEGKARPAGVTVAGHNLATVTRIPFEATVTTDLETELPDDFDVCALLGVEGGR